MPDSIETQEDTTPIGYQAADRITTGNVPVNPVAESLSRIADFSERQREKFPPTVIDLSPTAGLPIASTFSSHVRLRVVGLLLTSSAAETFTLIAGGARFVIYVAAGACQFIPLPIEIAEGIDINISNAAAHTTFSAYLFAYPES